MIVLNTLLFALAAFLASFLLLGLAWVWRRGKAAALRHMIWTGAFAVLLAVPAAALLLPSQVSFNLAAPAAAPATAAPAPAFATVDFITVIAALWFAGVAFHLAKLAFGGIGLSRLTRNSVAHIPQGIDDRPTGAGGIGRCGWMRDGVRVLGWQEHRPVHRVPGMRGG